jgi:ATP-binding cassette, subfamily B, bacterial PglK
MHAHPPSTSRKLWELLTPPQRKGGLVLFGFMLVGMVLETLGIGLVIPVLAVLTQADAMTRFPVVAESLDRLGNPTQSQIIVIGMFALVGFHCVRVAFMGFLAWRQAQFTFALQARFSQRLFEGYLRQPYTFHLQRNSAQLIRDTTTQVGEITSVVHSGLLLSTEALVVLGTSVLLLAVEPIGSIVVIVTFALASWVFSRKTRARVVRWGEARQVHEALRLQHLQQGLGGAKDIKLLGREGDFLAQYATHSTGSSLIGERLATLQAFPRLWLEILAIAELATLVFVMVASGRQLDAILPTLGLFAAAAFRLMPSVSRILSAVQTVRASDPVINNLHAEIESLERQPPSVSGEVTRLEDQVTLSGVGFRYAGTEAFALRDVTLAVPRGTSVGIIGASGSGKSTLVDVILGLFAPETGAVRVDGVDIQTDLRGWQDQIGYVPQSIYLTDDSLLRNVAFGVSQEDIDEAAVRQAIRNAHLEDFVRELPEGLESVVGERGVRLSGGQRQRIGIARALYHDPPVLVLDEATSSVDTLTEQSVMEAIQALHGAKTILIVAHRLSTVAHCDRVFRLDCGRLIAEGDASIMIDGVEAPR